MPEECFKGKNLKFQNKDKYYIFKGKCIWGQIYNNEKFHAWFRLNSSFKDDFLNSKYAAGQVALTWDLQFLSKGFWMKQWGITGKCHSINTLGKKKLHQNSCSLSANRDDVDQLVKDATGHLWHVLLLHLQM